MKINQFL